MHIEKIGRTHVPDTIKVQAAHLQQLPKLERMLQQKSIREAFVSRIARTLLRMAIVFVVPGTTVQKSAEFFLKATQIGPQRASWCPAPHQAMSQQSVKFTSHSTVPKGILWMMQLTKAIRATCAMNLSVIVASAPTPHHAVPAMKGFFSNLEPHRLVLTVKGVVLDGILMRR